MSVGVKDGGIGKYGGIGFSGGSVGRGSGAGNGVVGDKGLGLLNKYGSKK